MEIERDEGEILDDSGFWFHRVRVHKKSSSILDMSGISRQRQPIENFTTRSGTQERELWWGIYLIGINM